MRWNGKKLGLLVSVPPGHPNFDRCVALAAAAATQGIQIFLYCIDDAVTGVTDERIVALERSGARIFACGYGAQRRGERSDGVIYAGLTLLHDIIIGTDRFLSFN